MVVPALLQENAEIIVLFAVAEQQLSIAHAQAYVVALQSCKRNVVELVGTDPHLHGEVGGGKFLLDVSTVGVCPTDGSVGASEAHGVVLVLVARCRCTDPFGYNIDPRHGVAGRAEGDASAHRARSLGEADDGGVVGDGSIFITPVLYRHAVVVIDARQRRVVGVVQALLAACQGADGFPRLALMFGGAPLYDVGLGIGGALQVDMPIQLYQTRIDSLCGIC